MTEREKNERERELAIALQGRGGLGATFYLFLHFKRLAPMWEVEKRGIRAREQVCMCWEGNSNFYLIYKGTVSLLSSQPNHKALWSVLHCQSIGHHPVTLQHSFYLLKLNVRALLSSSTAPPPQIKKRLTGLRGLVLDIFFFCCYFHFRSIVLA